MREIKFRGKSVKGGAEVHADVTFTTLNGQEVDPDSVEQFIAYDKGSRAIYEGDIVRRIEPEGGLPMRATFEDYGAIRAGEIIKCEQIPTIVKETKTPKRRINFRARTVPEEETIYGGYVVRESKYFTEHTIHGRDMDSWRRSAVQRLVKPESVVQLVGYDAAGNEVYEGDKLINSNGEEYTAKLVAVAVDSDGKERRDLIKEA